MGSLTRTRIVHPTVTRGETPHFFLLALSQSFFGEEQGVARRDVQPKNG